MRAGTRIATIALVLLGAGAGAVQVARRTEPPPHASESSAVQIAETRNKSPRAAVSAPRASTVGHVIAGRVTGLAPGATARVEARRTGDFPPPAPTRFRPVGIDAPLRATPPSAVADAPDGTFALSVAAPGAYVVTATSSDGRETSKDAGLPEAMERTEVEIALPPGDEVLRGRVVRADGAPFRGWVVLRQRDDASEEIVADRAVEPGADGRFEFRGLRSGHANVEAIVPGVVSVVARGVAIPADEETVLTISAGTRRRGRVVVDPEGTPVAGARVLACVENGSCEECSYTVTDAGGAFDVPSVAHVDVSVEAPGLWYESTEKNDPGPDEVVVHLVHTCVVTGQVRRSSDGSPVAGAGIVAGAPATSLPWLRAASAADGSYRLGELAPGVWYDVYVLGGGWASVKLLTGQTNSSGYDPFVLKLPPGAEETVDFHVEPSARVTGHVAGPTGDPVRAARVELHLSFESSGPVPEVDWWRTVWTGADGAFEFPDLPGATDFCVEATAAGLSPNLASGKLTAGEQPTADIRLEAPRRLDVLVLAAATGAPVPEAKVTLERLIGDGHAHVGDQSHVTDARGHCVIESVPVGRLGVSVEASGFVPTPHDAPVAAVENAADPGVYRVEVRLEPTLAVEGTLLRADGTPAAGVTLFVHLPADVDPDERSVCVTETDRDGAFHISGLAAGTYPLNPFLGPAFGPAPDLPPVVAGTTGVVLRLPPEKPREATVGCILVGPDGGRVSRARVDLRSPGRSDYGWVADGKFAVSKDGDSPGGVLAIYRPVGADGKPLPLGATAVQLPKSLPDPFEVRLQAERVVTGRVVGFDGTGAPNVPLYVRFVDCDTEDWLSEVTSGADGSFEIHGLGEGAFRVEVSLPKDQGEPPPLTVHGGQTGVVLNLLAGAGGIVTVSDADGRPVRGATVEVRATTSDAAAKPLARLVTCGDGKVRVNGLASGVEVALVITGPANRDDVASRTISPWEPRDTDVRLERSASAK